MPLLTSIPLRDQTGASMSLRPRPNYSGCRIWSGREDREKRGEKVSDRPFDSPPVNARKKTPRHLHQTTGELLQKGQEHRKPLARSSPNWSCNMEWPGSNGVGVTIALLRLLNRGAAPPPSRTKKHLLRNNFAWKWERTVFFSERKPLFADGRRGRRLFYLDNGATSGLRALGPLFRLPPLCEAKPENDPGPPAAQKGLPDVPPIEAAGRTPINGSNQGGDKGIAKKPRLRACSRGGKLPGRFRLREDCLAESEHVIKRFF